jgi:hypothetical protein
MYYIYEKSSTLIMGKVYMGEMRPDHRKSYKTMAAAKAALSRASKQWWNLLGRNGDPTENDPQYRMGIAEAGFFHEFIEKGVMKRSLMNGNDYFESVNTPAYMSPASETYWSM